MDSKISDIAAFCAYYTLNKTSTQLSIAHPPKLKAHHLSQTPKKSQNKIKESHLQVK